MLSKIRANMKSKGIDTVFLNTYENNKVSMNLFYATNFSGSSGSTLITQDVAYFITDFRYQSSLDMINEGYEIIIQKPGQLMFDVLKELVDKHSIKSLHIDPNMYYSEATTLKEKYNLELNSFGSLFDECRNVKTEGELKKIKKACEITDQAYQYLLSIAKPGMKEIELAKLLERKMVDLGAKEPSFDTILVSGVSGALPHGVPSEKELATGELVTVDFGCYYDNYASDMTRTFAVGDIDDKLQEIYDVVLKAQLAGVAAVKAGVAAKDVDNAARSVIEEAGYGEYFGHGLGHGLGIDVHESIRLSSQSTDILEEGNVVTIEPGIYIPGVGGVRIEDDVVVTKTGCDILNETDKNLIKI